MGAQQEPEAVDLGLSSSSAILSLAERERLRGCGHRHRTRDLTSEHVATMVEPRRPAVGADMCANIRVARKRAHLAGGRVTLTAVGT